MPIHDWVRVDANLFHHFHQRWTIAICDALNTGLLPKGYSALVGQQAVGPVPDLIVTAGRGGGVTPGTLTAFHTVRTPRAVRANRVTIRHALGEIVCVIEIVSPGNKGSRNALQAFVRKTVEFIGQGVHVLVVDPFPPTPRDPAGIHKAIWDEFDEDEPFALPPDKPLTLAAYVADDPLRAYVQPAGVGDVLPDMPAYLDPDAYVPVPLEATYQAAWATCPEDMRVAVERGELPADDGAD